MKLYALYDNKSDRFLSVTLSTTDADFVRSNLYAILMDYPIQDVKAFCVGDFFEESGIIIPCLPREVDWNCYQFPKNADSFDEVYLTISELRQSALAKRKKFDELKHDKIEELTKLVDDISVQIKSEEITDKQKDNLIAYREQLLNTISAMEAKLNG